MFFTGLPVGKPSFKIPSVITGLPVGNTVLNYRPFFFLREKMQFLRKTTYMVRRPLYGFCVLGARFVEVAGRDSFYLGGDFFASQP